MMNSKYITKKKRFLGILSVLGVLCSSEIVSASESVTHPSDSLRTVNGVAGSLAPLSSLSGNSVTLNGAVITGDVYGGINLAGTSGVSNNLVFVTNATARRVFGGYSVNGIVEKNQVTISNSTINNIAAGGYSNNTMTTTVDNNSLTVIGTTNLKAKVYGGYNGKGNTSHNTVTLGAGVSLKNGSAILEVTGGRAERGGSSYFNTVNIDGALINGVIWGGWSWDGDAIGNTVNIKDGTYFYDIYGGYSRVGQSTGNTVSLSGSPVFDLSPTAGVEIYGGAGSSGLSYSGNTLIVNNPIGSPFYKLGNFENYQFFAPSTVQNGDTMLQVANKTDLGIGAKVSLNFQGGGNSLAVGDEIVLIGGAGNITGTLATTNITSSSGIALLYDMDMFISPANAGDLVAKVKGVQVHPAAKVPVEGIIGSLGMLLSGNNHLIYQGIPEAKALKGNHIFATATANHLRLNSGSHVDVDGTNLIVGTALNKETSSGVFLIAPFIEAGWGNYDTHNRFASYTVWGEGDTNYYGGGLFVRYDVTKGKRNGLYMDAALHGGKSHNQFSSDDLVSHAGEPVKYKLDNPYYSAHAGLGYQWEAKKNIKLDISGRYLWTRQDGNSAVIQGDRFKFDALQSHRTQVGGKVLFTKNERITPYVGLTYEHEFGGTAKAKVQGRQIESPSLKGDTGIGEIGIMIKPKQQKGQLSLDIKLLGNFGKKEGVGASLYVDYKF